MITEQLLLPLAATGIDLLLGTGYVSDWSVANDPSGLYSMVTAIVDQRLDEEREKWQQERTEWQREKQEWQREKLQWLKEKRQWQREKLQWLKEKRQWQREKLQWLKEKRQWQRHKQQWLKEKRQWQREKLQWLKEKRQWQREKLQWLKEKRQWQREKQSLQQAARTRSTPLEKDTDSESYHLHSRSDDTDYYHILERALVQANQRVSEMEAEVQALKKADVNREQAIVQAASTTFIRWGRSVCPNSTRLVYTGVVGGGGWSQIGSSTTVPRSPLDH